MVGTTGLKVGREIISSLMSSYGEKEPV